MEIVDDNILQREIGVVKLSLTLCKFWNVLINTDLAFLQVCVLSCTSCLAFLFTRRPLLVYLIRTSALSSTQLHLLFFTCYFPRLRFMTKWIWWQKQSAKLRKNMKIFYIFLTLNVFSWFYSNITISNSHNPTDTL